MTVIVAVKYKDYDENKYGVIVSADTRVTDGGWARSGVRKCIQTPEQVVVAYCGLLAPAIKTLYLLPEVEPSEVGDLTLEDYANTILIPTYETVLNEYEGKTPEHIPVDASEVEFILAHGSHIVETTLLSSYEVNAPFIALGSGGDVASGALAAMFLNYELELPNRREAKRMVQDAIQIASVFNAQCFGQGEIFDTLEES